MICLQILDTNNRLQIPTSTEPQCRTSQCSAISKGVVKHNNRYAVCITIPTSFRERFKRSNIHTITANLQIVIVER